MLPVVKDPQSILDYALDWGAWLGEGDTVQAATWAAAPTGAGHLAIESSSLAGAVATVWVSGGVVGTDYSLTCHVTTSGGREEDMTIPMECRQR